MSTAANRYGKGLNIDFDYDVEPAIGDRLEISSSGRKAQALTERGGTRELGECIDVNKALKECTVRIDAIHNRIDRIAGEAVVPGLGFFGPQSRVYQYVPAAPARHDGTTTGPKTVTVDVDDTIKVKIEGGSSQTIVITAGENLTFAAIAAEVNATLTDMHLEVDAAGHMNLVADDIFRSVEVEAVATDAYTLLGWTAAVYEPTTPNHDPHFKPVQIIVGGAEGAAIETLER